MSGRFLNPRRVIHWLTVEDIGKRAARSVKHAAMVTREHWNQMVQASECELLGALLLGKTDVHWEFEGICHQFKDRCRDCPLDKPCHQHYEQLQKAVERFKVREISHLTLYRIIQEYRTAINGILTNILLKKGGRYRYIQKEKKLRRRA